MSALRKRKRILWVDDEIDLLRAHLIFLEEKGYYVKGVPSGQECLELIAAENFDLVLLDETMPGKSGLQTLHEIKEVNANLPVIMITKNEEEGLMDQAIGMKIDGYLLKPVNPLQIYSASKRILESHKIQEGIINKEYLQFFHSADNLIGGNIFYEDWIKIHKDLTYWDLEFDRFSNTGLNQTHMELRDKSNMRFGRFIEKEYVEWVNSVNGPKLSVDLFDQFVFPHLDSNKAVYLIVIDCMRYDQWLMMEDLLADFYTINRDFFYATLPTATPYSRNSIFSGLHPIDIKKKYPSYWMEKAKNEETGKNLFEDELMREQLNKKGFGKIKSKYIKIYDSDGADNIQNQVATYKSLDLVAIVINFIDILSHGRSHSRILSEISPDESAFRSLTRSWFIHSVLFEILKKIVRQDATVLITTDHGSILSKKAALIRANKKTSTNLRYKFGENISSDKKYCYHVSNPVDLRLPAESPSKNYVFAKENYYFVYPTDFHKYEKQFRGSFQHGGISLEEMIVPCVTLESK
ncbi:MAG: bifunctional response regulator/alkaline phosphatase family protein [Candidatus Krumholzibacteriota bacterium]|nr:bifunctional response regulator/alkaline phosphatase family protein [Candidatus Krumholzibacteriota bacterium]